MCAIIDASVTFEVFGQRQTKAGTEFRGWLDNNRGKLVVGGKNLTELQKNSSFSRWFLEARRLEGKVQQIKNTEISEVQLEIVQRNPLKSDDEHVLALATVSGARLLYTNDKDLQRDFGNPKIISSPYGKIYTTLISKTFSPGHRDLLEEENLCRRRD